MNKGVSTMDADGKPAIIDKSSLASLTLAAFSAALAVVAATGLSTSMRAKYCANDDLPSRVNDRNQLRGTCSRLP